MPATPTRERVPNPARCLYDRSSQTLTVVVDAMPATAEDITVEVGTTQVDITVRHPEREVVRTVTPPTRRHELGDDRSAHYNNGVLTISIGVKR